MIQQDPNSFLTQSSSLLAKSRSRITSWRFLAIILAIAHGLLNWWSVRSLSGGFWVMEPTKLTPIERFAEVLTLLLNVPSLVVTYVFGFPPFAFTMPVVAIANSCLYGATLALLVVYCRNKKRTPQHDALRT